MPRKTIFILALGCLLVVGLVVSLYFADKSSQAPARSINETNEYQLANIRFAAADGLARAPEKVKGWIVIRTDLQLEPLRNATKTETNVMSQLFAQLIENSSGTFRREIVEIGADKVRIAARESGGRTKEVVEARVSPLSMEGLLAGIQLMQGMGSSVETVEITQAKRLGAEEVQVGNETLLCESVALAVRARFVSETASSGANVIEGEFRFHVNDGIPLDGVCKSQVDIRTVEPSQGVALSVVNHTIAYGQ